MKFEILKIEEHAEKAGLRPLWGVLMVQGAASLGLQCVKYIVTIKVTNDEGQTSLYYLKMNEEKQNKKGYTLEIYEQTGETEEAVYFGDFVTFEQWLEIKEKVTVEAEKLSAALLEKLRKER